MTTFLLEKSVGLEPESASLSAQHHELFTLSSEGRISLAKASVIREFLILSGSYATTGRGF